MGTKFNCEHSDVDDDDDDVGKNRNRSMLKCPHYCSGKSCLKEAKAPKRDTQQTHEENSVTAQYVKLRLFTNADTHFLSFFSLPLDPLRKLDVRMYNTTYLMLHIYIEVKQQVSLVKH